MSKRLSAANVRSLLNKLIADASALTIAGATNASPSVINITAHGLSVGDVLFIVGTTGNTAINGLRVVAAAAFDADHVTCTDFFTAAAVNGNGVTGGSPTAQRVKWGGTVDDANDLVEESGRTKFSVGHIADKDRPSALETTIATAFGQ